MPLQDHFHPPLSLRRHWHAFHNAWATYLSSQLNAALPQGFFAEPNVQFGIEIDVAAWDEKASDDLLRFPGNWSPGAPTATIPLPLLTDLVEIQLFETSAGPQLAAAIELVSPGNKDRPESRDAFVSKCAAYLQQGIGLIVVDVVTSKHPSLHAHLLSRLNSSKGEPSTADLYSAAYHPVRHGEETALEFWFNELTLGSTLPTAPLWLKNGPMIPVDFEAAYERTCQEQRLPKLGA